MEQQVTNREAFVTECTCRFDKVERGTREKIADGRRRIERLQQELTTTVREVMGAERKLEQLLASKPAELDAYGREFDNLIQVENVTGVEVSSGVIKVFTDQINIEHDGITYLIGKFRIEIYTSGSNCGIRFFNLTNQGKGPGYNNGTSYNRHHPHVQDNGSPCLGNISTTIHQLIGEGQYTVVAILGIQFLKSVNAEDSAGAGIVNWPKEGDETPATDEETKSVHHAPEVVDLDAY